MVPPRKFFRSLFAPLVMLLACGGRVGEIGGGGDDGGGGQQGGTDAASCPSPALVSYGETCNLVGATCLSSTLVSDCNGQPAHLAQCNCVEGGRSAPTWDCGNPAVILGVNDCPESSVLPPYFDAGGGTSSGCPDPSSIVDGASCSTAPELKCPGMRITVCPSATTFLNTCICQGSTVTPHGTTVTWSCGSIPPQPTSPCPDPTRLTEGVACSPLGQRCPGNPQSCGGSQTFYDAFQCSSACQWSRIATTDCLDAAAPNSD
jgi:hypothetical protein